MSVSTRSFEYVDIEHTYVTHLYEENEMKHISRREFLRVSALSATGVALAACAKTAEPTQAPEAATATPKPAEATATPVPAVGAAGKEAPILADQVSA